MTETIIIRKDTREEELGRINKGDVVELLEILSAGQHDVGRVVYSDGAPSFMKIISTRIDQDRIIQRPYFPTPLGIKPSGQFRVFESPSSEFTEANGYLLEEGL